MRVLGLGSDVGATASPFSTEPRSEDLYRYDQLGNRSFTTTGLAYFRSMVRLTWCCRPRTVMDFRELR